MNISFFIKPKIEVSYLYDDIPVRQAMNEMLKTDFTAARSARAIFSA